MPYPQPIVTYSGIIGIESCRMLLSRSVEPSQAVIETPVISQVAPAIGDLVFFYNGTTLTFSGCAVDMSYIAMTAAGQTMRITLLDRRWRWAFTEIVGRYNVKTKTDTIKYEKTPQELATLIFQAMGETVYDVSELPNDARPMVDWTNEKGSVALADLLSQLNCEVVPDLSTGGWRIVKIGTGDLLPDDGTAETAESGVTSPITPDAIRAVTASIRYQVMFELEAVGTETDGRSRPIDDLSYKPSGGWELEHPEKFKGVTGTYVKDGVTRELRDLALGSVYRDYRIKRCVGGGGDKQLDPPGYEEAIAGGAPHVTSIESLLPLVGDLNDVTIDDSNEKLPARPYLQGQWTDGGHGTPEGNVDAGTRWNAGFDLDLEQGIVRMPTWLQYDPGGDDGNYQPAKLWLTIVCEVTWEGLNKKVYFGQTRLKTGVVTPVLVSAELREDIIPKYTARYTQVSSTPSLQSIEKNSDEVNAQTAHYLDAMEDQLVDRTSGSASYANLLLIQLDGAIENVEWIVDGNGMTTNASRFMRLATYVPSYKDTKRQSMIDQAVRDANRNRFRGDVDTRPITMGVFV